MATSEEGRAIRVRGLTKRFGALVAVDDVDLDIPRRHVYGFLGPNGSGKTTTIRMLTGTSAPNAGQARVLGEDVALHPERVRPRFGYMSQKFALFEDMTVAENLRFYAGVYNLAPERFAEQRAYVLEMADLKGRENELTANLSVGWRQRLALGTATIHDPELLFLDEPTGGVDPVARRQFWDLLYELAGRGVTLFVTTHYMDEASHCNQLAFIYNGRLIAEGAQCDDLRASLDQARRIVQADLVVLAGQQPETQRRVGQQRDLVLVHRLVQAVVGHSVDQAVGILHRRHPRQTVLLGQADELAHAVGRLVRQADRAHLALAHQPVERAQLRLDRGDLRLRRTHRVEVGRAEHRHRPGRPVQLVEIDRLDAQSL